MPNLDINSAMGVTSTEKKNQKVVFVIRRSIFMIFIFFSALVMLLNLGVLLVGLLTRRLMKMIDEGASPPRLINEAIIAEAGATISLDAMAQAQNDLNIVKSFAE